MTSDKVIMQFIVNETLPLQERFDMALTEIEHLYKELKIYQDMYYKAKSEHDWQTQMAQFH